MERTTPRELTTKQAADLAGVSASYIRMLLADGTLKGRQPDGWVWLVDARAFEQWMAERRAPGRPKKDG